MSNDNNDNNEEIGDIQDHRLDAYAPPPPESVLSFIAEQWLKAEDVLRLRLVSKEFDERIGLTKSVEKLLFTVSKNEESIEAFCGLSPKLKVKHFRFVNLDLNEVNLLGDPGVLRYFTKNHCERIVTLRMENCRLFAGKFFEMLSYCPNLKHLDVRACPFMYQSDASPIYRGFYSKCVDRNLAGLATLKLVESHIPDKDLAGLTKEMKSLRRIHLECREGFSLPFKAIIDLLRKNSESLEYATLVGKLFGGIHLNQEELKEFKNVDGFLEQVSFPRMNALISLTLWGCYLDSCQKKLEVVEKLFGKCPKLYRLRISEANLESNISFSRLGSSLVELEICDCSMTRSTFYDTTFIRLRKLKVSSQTKRDSKTKEEEKNQTEDEFNEQGEYDSSDEMEVDSNAMEEQPEDNEDHTEASTVALLQGGVPMLDTVYLKLASGGGADYLNALTPSKFPRLSNVALTGFTNVAGQPLRQLFKNFPGLISFVLTDSKQLTDEDLCPIQDLSHDNGMEWSLGDLKNLRLLNLSRTPIGRRTLTECISLMKNLACLRLDGTNIDKTDLEAIFTAAANKAQYPNFRCVTITRCANCRLTPEEIRNFQEIASHVDMACTVDISNF